MSSFGHSLFIFIAEVYDDDYLGKTIYQLTFSIQKFFNGNGINWKLVDGPDFKYFSIVIDYVVEVHALQNIGDSKKQAQLIPLNFGRSLWDKGILGENEQEILRNTVSFLLTKD